MKPIYVMVFSLFIVMTNAMEKSSVRKKLTSFKFNLPLHQLTHNNAPATINTVSEKEDAINRAERTQQLSFMGSASQRSVRQELLSGFSKIGTPKNTNDLSLPFNQIALYKDFLELLDPHNFNPKKITRESEHVRAKSTFALATELLSLLTYHARDNVEATKKAETYKESIESDRINYYIEYYHYMGKKYKSKAQELFEQAEEEFNDFYRSLFYNTSKIFFKNAQFFYKKSYEIKKRFRPKKDNIMLQSLFEDSRKFVMQDIHVILKEVRSKIKSLPMQEQLIRSLEESKVLQKESAESLIQIEQEKKEFEEAQKRPVSFKKKELLVSIAKIKEKEIVKLDKAVFKDNHQQVIIEIDLLIKKKDYHKLALMVRDIDLNERKMKLFEGLCKVEELFIELAKVYLQLFDLSPKKKYLKNAEVTMTKLERIGGYKIDCYPHSIIILDTIKNLWDEIKRNQIIVEHHKNKELFDALKEAKLSKKEAYQWMI